MMIRLFLIGLLFGLAIIGLLYLIGFWQDGGDDWRDDDDTPEGPRPSGKAREYSGDGARSRELHNADD